MSSFPSGPVSQVAGRALVVSGEDIDTDRIIPARFLKCVSFDALGDQVFADDRRELKGQMFFCWVNFVLKYKLVKKLY